jgi:hypothetical protein
MSFDVQPIIRTVVKGAIGLSAPAEVQRMLEGHLFSEIVPAGDNGEIAKEAVDVLIDLYQQLADPEGTRTDLLSSAMRKLMGIAGVAGKDPIGAIAFALHQVAMAGQITGRDATRMALLPWESLVSTPSDPLSIRLILFSQLLRCFAHEVDEGFVAPTAQDAELYEEAKCLSEKLRSALLADSPLKTGRG